MFAGSAAGLIAGSLATLPPPAEAQALVWTPALGREAAGTPWYADYRWQAAALLALTAALVFTFS